MTISDVSRGSASYDMCASDVDGTQVVTVPAAGLRFGRAFREKAISEARVAELMRAPERWSAILVATDMTVIDGRHRVTAARRLGIEQVTVEIFEGDAQDAFLEFVQRNLTSGEGLNRRERSKAARRILCAHPEWADRRIGDLCGVSPKAVGQMRQSLMRTFAPGQIDWSDVRIGRDGRSRPIDPANRRARIIEALAANPDISLRSIARLVGVSPETVRRVRLGLSEPTWSPPIQIADVPPAPLARRRVHWQPDAAIRANPDSLATADFMVRTDVDDLDLERHANGVPQAIADDVIQHARRCAEFWLSLAVSAEARTRQRRV